MTAGLVECYQQEPIYVQPALADPAPAPGAGWAAAPTATASGSPAGARARWRAQGENFTAGNGGFAATVFGQHLPQLERDLSPHPARNAGADLSLMRLFSSQDR